MQKAVKEDLLAIGFPRSMNCTDVIKFQSEKPDEVTFAGRVEGDSGSGTVFFKGDIFIIGGYDDDFRLRVSKFDIITQKTHRMADLLVARPEGHSVAASLDEVFVCGGSHEEISMVNCEAFNPHTNAWRVLPDLQQSRGHLTVTFLPDGRFLATGGVDSLGNALSSCEMLDSAFQPEAVWRQVAAMREARESHAAVYFEGLVFVAVNETAEIFTPPPLNSSSAELGQWTSLSNMTREITSIRSLVPVSANEIIAFGWEGEMERLQRKASASSEQGVEAWNWTPLPNISHLIRVCGVHFLII